jgi:hypothetical protein
MTAGYVRSMQLPGLDRDQSVAFVYEVNATRNTLSYATRIVATDALTDNTRDPIMSLMAAGLERLYKLTLGVIAIDRDGSWSDSKRFGHQIEKMHPEILDELERRSSASSYLRDLIRVVRDDRVLLAVIKCADTYGREGRYFYLDSLAGKQPRASSPHQAWRTVEATVLQHIDLAEPSARAAEGPADTERWRTLTTVRGAVINRSVINVWEVIAMCCVQGAVGELGRIFGRDVKPASVGRQ